MFLSIFKMMLNAERCSVLPSSTVSNAMLGIRILIFLVLLDPEPLAKGMDPDPSIIKQN